VAKNYIKEPERKTEVVLEADVVVAGGGPFGFPAAIAAARNGMETVLIERYSAIGGVGTTGLCNVWMGTVPQVDGGVFREIKTRTISAGGLVDGYYAAYDPEVYVLILNDMIAEEDVKLLLYTTAVDVVVEGSSLKGVIVESKSGRQAILGKVVIDATGDGDVAVRAGASYEATDISDRQACTLMFRVGGVDVGRLKELVEKFGLRRGTLPDLQANPYPNMVEVDKDLIKKAHESGILEPEVGGIILMGLEDRTWYETGMISVNSAQLVGDACNNEDLTAMEVKARKINAQIVEFLKNNIPGMEKCFLSYNAATMGVRESRRIIGDYVLTKNDVLTAKKFEDTIANNRFPMQGRGPGPVFTNIEIPKTYNIPYRCLVPKGLDNILVGGRDISMDHMVLMSQRTMPLCFSIGQAAGTAAALSIKNNVTPRRLDVKLLQKTLMDQGAALNLFRV
jgi:hypothetical protein